MSVRRIKQQPLTDDDLRLRTRHIDGTEVEKVQFAMDAVVMFEEGTTSNWFDKFVESYGSCQYDSFEEQSLAAKALINIMEELDENDLWAHARQEKQAKERIPDGCIIFQARFSLDWSTSPVGIDELHAGLKFVDWIREHTKVDERGYAESVGSYAVLYSYWQAESKG